MAANDDIEVRDGFCNFYVSRVARVTDCYNCLHTLVIMLLLVDADAVQFKRKFTVTMPHFPDEIEYSEKYQDDDYEYRHVLLPRATYKQMPRNRLLFEEEWRHLGV